MAKFLQDKYNSKKPPKIRLPNILGVEPHTNYDDSEARRAFNLRYSSNTVKQNSLQMTCNFQHWENYCGGTLLAYVGFRYSDDKRTYTTHFPIILSPTEMDAVALDMLQLFTYDDECSQVLLCAPFGITDNYSCNGEDDEYETSEWKYDNQTGTSLLMDAFLRMNSAKLLEHSVQLTSFTDGYNRNTEHRMKFLLISTANT